LERSIPAKHPRRDASDCRPRRDGLEYDGASADARAGTDFYVPQDDRTRIDQVAMSHLVVALALLLSRPAECDVLKDRHVVLDDAGLSDHDARRVVEEYPDAQTRGGMNVDLQGA
jgi:hypothetical protein